MRFLGLDSSTQSLTALIVDTDTGEVIDRSVAFGARLPRYDSPNGFLANDDPRIKHSNPLMWVEALDNGDLKNKVPFRDKILALKAPFTGPPKEIYKTEQRFGGMQFFEKGGRALVSDTERLTRRIRSFIIEVDDPGSAPILVWSRNQQDRYRDPGTPRTKPLPSGGSPKVDRL